MFHFGLCDPHEGTKGVIDRLCIREGGGNVIVKFDDIHPLAIAGGILPRTPQGIEAKSYSGLKSSGALAAFFIKISLLSCRFTC